MQGQLHVFRHDSGVERRLLFGGIGIDLAADTFDGMDDLPSRMVRRALENTMLDIVRHAVLFRHFIPRTCTHHHAYVRHRTRRPPVYNFDAVW